MALGGGTFLVQNKKLPGTYINFVSIPRPFLTFNDRGYAAIAMKMDWGDDGITTVEPADLQKDSLELFGYSYTDEKMKPIRDLMLNASTAYIGRLNGGGKKAEVTEGGLTARAKYSGTRGNDIMVVVENELGETGNMIVKTLVDGYEADRQRAKMIGDLKNNAFVDFSGTGELNPTAGVKLAGGSNGEVKNEAHVKFLDELEKYYVNVIGYAGTDETIKKLYGENAKRLRNADGNYVQTVLYAGEGNTEGIISVATPADEDPAGLVYWVTGASAGCAVNRSLTNRAYDGEYTVSTRYKQRELMKLLDNGRFVFHIVDNEVRVLEDINTFRDFSPEKNKDFSQNQVIRVIDQLAGIFSTIFNKRFLGKVPNDEEGRISLWSEFVKAAETMQGLRAIQNFNPEDIIVRVGEEKNSVYVEVAIQPTMAMTKLYAVIRVR